jgi:hypothetical protein
LLYPKSEIEKMRVATVVLAAILGWLSAVAGATATDEHSFVLEVLWSTPIAPILLSLPAGTPYNPGPEPGTIFEAQALNTDGGIVFLGSRIISGKRVMAVFADPEKNPSKNAIALVLNGAHPLNLHIFSRLAGTGPRPFTLAVGAPGEIWVGGGSNSYMDFASGDHRDAYLAKIDGAGKTLWEKAYGNGGWRQVMSVSSLSAGEVAVTGEDAGQGWLARIGVDGGQLWERHLGIAKYNAVASLSRNRVVVAGFEATGAISSGDYQEHIAAWIVDESGKILAQKRVRNAINTVSGSHYGHLSVATTKDAIYIISSWTEFSHVQPIEVSKLDLGGNLLWTTSLPDNNAKWSPALAVNPGGDPLVAFAVNGRIRLYQFNQLSGSYDESDLAMPDCGNGYAVPLFLAIRNDGTVILSGSPPELNTVPRCTWVARLTQVH